MFSKCLSLVAIGTLFFAVCGCAQIVITSDPPGADIYSGPHPGYLTKGGKTPFKLTVGGLYFVSPVYYQLKKDGYEDTGIVHFPAGAPVHAIHATLTPAIRPIRQQSSATGFAISEKGLIVTAYHVIKDAKVITVYLSKDSVVSAKVIHGDPVNDLALLQIENPTPIFLQIAPMRSVKMGDKVFTIGFPMSAVLGREAKYSDGVVSSPSGPKDASSFLQITVPIQPGSSGGPLVNERGEVVGIITSTAAILPFIKESGALPQNVNWAVKADYLRPLIELPKAEQKEFNREQIIDRVKRATFVIEAKEQP
ncbi:MAG TPA: trypsin-like peptidase domain-containing protein [Candidatus Brocadiales bacterium]|nr:trypsin-like peptidase domain-containing protein [Candidatus Brocadiales bacterium]